MKTVAAAYTVNYPQVNVNTVSFTFQTTGPAGAFTFLFMWLNNQWNGWCTLPSGEIRQFGCIPGVVNWTKFTDFAIVFDSSYTTLGLANLVANSTLYILVWGPF